jgi:hypothetical protein
VRAPIVVAADLCLELVVCDSQILVKRVTDRECGCTCSVDMLAAAVFTVESCSVELGKEVEALQICACVVYQIRERQLSAGVLVQGEALADPDYLYGIRSVIVEIGGVLAKGEYSRARSSSWTNLGVCSSRYRSKLAGKGLATGWCYRRQRLIPRRFDLEVPLRVERFSDCISMELSDLSCTIQGSRIDPIPPCQ